jgi:two-component system, chemotaxis family, protein-glutamate methylesterase/glutaminase
MDGEPGPNDFDPATKSRYDLIVIAASAGGMEPLLQVLSGFPPDFSAAIIAVQHLHPQHKSYLTEIASRRTKMNVKQAEDGDRITPGWVYIAPPDYHIRIGADSRLALTHDKPKNFVRPSADILFETAAQQYKDRLIALVLSGSGKDGKEGVCKVKQMGGFNIAQDQETAAYFDMPRAAISTEMVDLILPVDQISNSILALVRTGTVK